MPAQLVCWPDSVSKHSLHQVPPPRAFLGGVHGVAAELMAGGDTTVSPAMTERVATLARDAEPWERRQAVADLGAIGDASILTLVSSVPESLIR